VAPLVDLDSYLLPALTKRDNEETGDALSTLKTRIPFARVDSLMPVSVGGLDTLKGTFLASLTVDTDLSP
jgi:hypothetical protein